MRWSKLFMIVVSSMLIFGVIGEDKQEKDVFQNNVWKRIGAMAGMFLNSCSPYDSSPEENILVTLQRCLKDKLLAVLNRVLEAEQIAIAEGIELVKVKDSFSNVSRKTSSLGEWEEQALDIVAEIFETHNLKVNLQGLVQQAVNANEGRRRHRHQHMTGSLMMFGVVAMGMLLVPMGFKFLTILGAKALLLAKMSLLLSSIQGLKKVATSGYNYGLYHSANPWHYDRYGMEEVPEEQMDVLHHKITRN